MKTTLHLHLPRAGTALIVIDVQQKLVPNVAPALAESSLRNMRILAGGIQALELPMVLTEQYPKGLGATLPALRQALPGSVQAIEKVEFSCGRVAAVADALRSKNICNVILCGMETHVCVLQSAVDFVEQGLNVWVARDACMSRTVDNWHAGLHLCERAGAQVAPTETILFMLMGKSGTPEFKAISALIK